MKKTFIFKNFSDYLFLFGMLLIFIGAAASIYIRFGLLLCVLFIIGIICMVIGATKSLMIDITANKEYSDTADQKQNETN
jgi:hypothetical protein